MRASPSEIAEVVKVKEGDDITLFQRIASSLTDEVEEAGMGDEERLKHIEIFLTGHFYSLKEPLAASLSMGRLSMTSQGMTGMFLESTFYGQAALVLDTTKTLHRLNTGKPPKTASILWLGTDTSTDSCSDS